MIDLFVKMLLGGGVGLTVLVVVSCALAIVRSTVDWLNQRPHRRRAGAGVDLTTLRAVPHQVLPPAAGQQPEQHQGQRGGAARHVRRRGAWRAD